MGAHTYCHISETRQRDNKAVTIEIDRADFKDPRLAVFLQDHLNELASTTPVESRHALNLDALNASTVRLWVAREGVDVVGTGALAAFESDHEELKSMRTEPVRRGNGVATRLLDHLLADARTRNIQRISLETGSAESFAPARALYAKAGFVPCPPFGSYAPDPNSIFMTLGF
jgi:putative acetyltransferase